MLSLKLIKTMQSFFKKLCINRKEIAKEVSKAAEANTYVETVAPSLADSLHWNVSRNYTETITIEFSRFSRDLIRKQRFGAVQLLADITEEDFYGDTTSNMHIHGWTGEKGVKGKIRYLVVALQWRNKTIPFYVSILPVGAFKAEYLGKALDYAQSLGLRIENILLDRGFYSGDIINTLQLKKMHYLIFVPKYKKYQYMLDSVEKQAIIEYEIVYSKNKSKHRAETPLVLLKNYLNYDWVFASDLFFADATRYVSFYKKRWNIETMFRVHDEARIKSKSRKAEIRLFYFVISMLFLLVWNLFVKSEIVFKRFVIEIAEQLAEELASVNI